MGIYFFLSKHPLNTACLEFQVVVPGTPNRNSKQYIIYIYIIVIIKLSIYNILFVLIFTTIITLKTMTIIVTTMNIDFYCY